MESKKHVAKLRIANPKLPAKARADSMVGADHGMSDRRVLDGRLATGYDVAVM